MPPVMPMMVVVLAAVARRIVRSAVVSRSVVAGRVMNRMMAGRVVEVDVTRRRSHRCDVVSWRRLLVAAGAAVHAFQK